MERSFVPDDIRQLAGAQMTSGADSLTAATSSVAGVSTDIATGSVWSEVGPRLGQAMSATLDLLRQVENDLGVFRDSTYRAADAYEAVEARNESAGDALLEDL